MKMAGAEGVHISGAAEAVVLQDEMTGEERG